MLYKAWHTVSPDSPPFRLSSPSLISFLVSIFLPASSLQAVPFLLWCLVEQDSVCVYVGQFRSHYLADSSLNFLFSFFLLQGYLSPQKLNQLFHRDLQNSQQKTMSHLDRKAPRMLVLQCDQTKRQSDTLKPSGTMSLGFSFYWSCTTAKRGTQYNSMCNLSLTKASPRKGETWAKTVSDLQASSFLSLSFDLILKYLFCEP